MSENISLFSPAKLNLFFRVIRRREDQFHEIASLFQTISLGDSLQLSLAEKDELFCNDPSIPLDERNLVSKAISLFRKKSGLNFHVKVDLYKKIPIESGLGGGSSNAATTLFALNRLLKTGFTDKELQSFSSEIGSDIPFFFSHGAAFCQGRGEIVEDLEPLRKEKLFLAKPQFGLSTPAVYRNCRPGSFLPRDPKEIIKGFYQGEPFYFNDLETSAFELAPSLVDLKQKLIGSGFDHVVMTGSGTSFFCFGKKEAPILPGIAFFPVQFLYREKEKWYEQ